MLTMNDHWLTADRVRDYARRITVAYIAIIAVLFVSILGKLGDVGQVSWYDFLAFWSVSLLTWSGNAIAAYDV